MTRPRIVLLSALPLLLFGNPAGILAADTRHVVSLAGQWTVKLDPKDVGEKGKWFDEALTDKIMLPGSLTENGYGDEITIKTPWTGQIVDKSLFRDEKYASYRQPGNVKLPFWLTPVKYYVGPAWYQKTIAIPTDWREMKIWLRLERPHWETTVWIDDRQIGTQNSLSTPHLYDLGQVAPGSHRLTIRVDNRVKIAIGMDAHSITDQTQTNWNGIVGRIELYPTDAVWIKDVQVYPDLAKKKMMVRAAIGNDTAKAVPCNLTLSLGSSTVHSSFSAVPNGSMMHGECASGDAELWDEFSPRVHSLSVRLSAKGEGKNMTDHRDVTFGMREIKTEGTRFLLNSKPLMVRGTLECCVFPLTGYPPTDVESWKRIIRVAKAHGLNQFRFHSFCPPEAAFQAADELGFLFQVECGVWCSVGVVRPVDDFIYAETERILCEYGNHPSFCLLAHGNEPSGRAAQFLAKWVEHCKRTDPRRLYTSGSGWPAIPENQYHVMTEPRIQEWGAGLTSRVNAAPPETTTDYRATVANFPNQPVVGHEIGQWCVYPNFDEIKKYTGVVRAYNFEIFRDSLKERHMLDQARDFLMASGKLQTLLYKEEIEAELRTKGLGGFSLLDLHDFPGQGSALVGVVDPFWDSKGYVTPAEFHRFACETVPLARMAKRVWTTDEKFQAEIEIAHFGPAPFDKASPTWEVRGQDGKPVAAGRLPSQHIPLGNGTRLGRIDLPLAAVAAPQKLNLEVRIEGTAYANDWDFWIYPPQVDTATPAGIVIADRLDSKALDALRHGGRVLLLPTAGTVKGDRRGRVPPGFSSIFWNTAWTRYQPPHTLGILCDPKQPALDQFPTEFHSNWQWWDLVSKSQIMILDGLPLELRPTVQVIDDWFTNRRLGLVFEAEVDGGKLLVCGIDLKADMDKRPVARQMLASLLHYMVSDTFRPRVSLHPEQVLGLFDH